jgi:16S rRNA (cytosine967-C5)-methyltransferase
LLAVESGQSVLDACAAPGGKTLHLLQSADQLRVTAVDIDPERLHRVAQNLARGGVEAELVAGDVVMDGAGAWSQRRYDRILLDAPCSATGVLRRHPDIRMLRRAEDIAALAARQSGLLAAMWRLLKPGGRLLYATCSILPTENAERIELFFAEHPDAVAVELPTRPGRRSGKGVQLLPGIDKTDGFFYAAVHKDAAAKR